MGKPDRDAAEPGERRLTDKGVVLVFDGERWSLDPAYPGDGEGTPIREDDDWPESRN